MKSKKKQLKLKSIVQKTFSEYKSKYYTCKIQEKMPIDAVIFKICAQLSMSKSEFNAIRGKSDIQAIIEDYGEFNCSIFDKIVGQLTGVPKIKSLQASEIAETVKCGLFKLLKENYTGEISSTAEKVSDILTNKLKETDMYALAGNNLDTSFVQAKINSMFEENDFKGLHIVVTGSEDTIVNPKEAEVAVTSTSSTDEELENGLFNQEEYEKLQEVIAQNQEELKQEPKVELQIKQPNFKLARKNVADIVIPKSGGHAIGLNRISKTNFVKVLKSAYDGSLESTAKTLELASRFIWRQQDIILYARNHGITEEFLQEIQPIEVPDEIKSTATKQLDIEAYEDTDTDPQVYKSGLMRNMLGLTDDLLYNIEILYKFYIERMKPDEAQLAKEKLAIRETIEEYITLFNKRNLDGADIVANRIAMVARKSNPKKHNLAYLVSCLRVNLENGFSTTNSSVDNRIIEGWEKVFGLKLSAKGKTEILRMITAYSGTEVLLALINADVPQDLEQLYLGLFEHSIKSNISKYRGKKSYTF